MHIYYFQVCSKHRYQSYGYPRGHTCPPSRGNHSIHIFKYVTHVHFYKYNDVDGNADASDNVISGNRRVLTARYTQLSSLRIDLAY